MAKPLLFGSTQSKRIFAFTFEVLGVAGTAGIVAQIIAITSEGSE